jgi:hypothetical protein
MERCSSFSGAPEKSTVVDSGGTTCEGMTGQVETSRVCDDVNTRRMSGATASCSVRPPSPHFVSMALRNDVWSWTVFTMVPGAMCAEIITIGTRMPSRSKRKSSSFREKPPGGVPAGGWTWS